MFERIGIAGAIETKEHLGEAIVAPGGKDLPDSVRLGRADEGVIYLSRARSLGTDFRIVELPGPQSMRNRIVFTVAELVDSGGNARHTDAERVIEFLLGSPGQRMLRAVVIVSVE